MNQSPPTLTVTETHKLLDALLGTGGSQKQFTRRLRNYTMAMVMLEAGLRVGEVVALAWGDLYFNCLPVTSIIIMPEISKSDTERQIPVSTRLSDALSTYHATCGVPDYTSPEDCAMQPLRKAFPMTTRQAERIIERAGLTALGRPIHPHVLRHTFASKLMRVTNASVVQALLGHKHLSSTQVYCHPNNDDLKGAIDKATTRDDTPWDPASDSPRPPWIPKNLDAADTDRHV